MTTHMAARMNTGWYKAVTLQAEYLVSFCTGRDAYFIISPLISTCIEHMKFRAEMNLVFAWNFESSPYKTYACQVTYCHSVMHNMNVTVLKLGSYAKFEAS